MATPPITPAGFIKERAPDGATFTLTQTGESNSLKTGDHVTVWTRIPDKNATARVLGVITGVEAATGIFTIMRTETEGPWPADADPLEPGSPVYRALRGTYEPDTAG